MDNRTNTSPTQPYQRPEVNPGSTTEFVEHLTATRTPEPIDPATAASNAELGYQPKHADPHPKASEFATRAALNG